MKLASPDEGRGRVRREQPLVPRDVRPPRRHGRVHPTAAEGEGGGEGHGDGVGGPDVAC